MTLKKVIVGYDDENNEVTDKNGTLVFRYPNLKYENIKPIKVKPMSLRERQSEFAIAIANLYIKIYEMGYEATKGDAYRDPRCPYGSKSSKHKRRLAEDINLFKDGKYLSKTSDHEPIGKIWESMGGIWGGRFDDGNHYEWPEE